MLLARLQETCRETVHTIINSPRDSICVLLVKGQVKKVSCQLTVSIAPCEKAYEVHLCTISVGSKLKYTGHAVLHKGFQSVHLQIAK